MTTARCTSVGGRHGGHAARGFTLIEMLVVVAIISILAAMIMPALLRAISGAGTADCVSHIRQIGTAYVAYAKGYDMVMVTGGDGVGEHDESWIWRRDMKRNTGQWHETYEEQDPFPYWYEAMVDRLRLDPRLFTCPAKKSAAVGYGYNYVAPYGVAGLYRDDNKTVHKQYWVWSTTTYNPGTRPIYTAYHPVTNKNQPSPVKILWYHQYAPYGALGSPSEQIAFCDTGKVINDQNLNVAPEDWEEDLSSNTKGYVRFPLYQTYTNSTKYRGTGSDADKCWRPVPRHGHKTVCGFFDGAAKAVPIVDIVSHEWWEGGCMFDNRPKHRPPIKKIWQ